MITRIYIRLARSQVVAAQFLSYQLPAEAQNQAVANIFQEIFVFEDALLRSGQVSSTEWGNVGSEGPTLCEPTSAYNGYCHMLRRLDNEPHGKRKRG